MACMFNSLDFSIFKDKIIVLAIIFFVMLSILLVFMVKSDMSFPQSANNTTEELNHPHLKVIERWTLEPMEGKYDCRLYDSMYGGSSPNGSSYGSCSKCNCTVTSIRDI